MLAIFGRRIEFPATVARSAPSPLQRIDLPLPSKEFYAAAQTLWSRA